MALGRTAAAVGVRGFIIRLALVLAWAGLLGWHALRYAFPDLGLNRSFDQGAILAVNLDRVFSYDLRRAAAGVPFAVCTLTLMKDEARYRSTTTLELKDLGVVPGLDALLNLLFHRHGARSSSLRATLSQILDARFRLVEAEASGEGMGMSFAAKGMVDSRGLHGRYRINDGGWTPIDLPAVSPDLAQGSDLALTLPPGLKPGAMFSTRMVHFDPIQMNARPAIGVFTVRSAETITVAGVSVACVRVELSVDNRPAAVMWADRDGVVYRLIQAGSGMSMELTSIAEVTGGAIWPAPAPTAGTVPPPP